MNIIITVKKEFSLMKEIGDTCRKSYKAAVGMTKHILTQKDNLTVCVNDAAQLLADNVGSRC